MKPIAKACMVLMVVGAGLTGIRGQQPGDTPKKVLRHVVLFSFKDGTSDAQVRAVREAFEALPGKIPEIQSFEWGLNNSPEGLNKGFTHCFFLTFRSEADRAVYLPHPDHKAFGELAGPYIADVLVVDYWTDPSEG